MKGITTIDPAVPRAAREDELVVVSPHARVNA